MTTHSPRHITTATLTPTASSGAGHTITQLNVTAVVPANAKKLGSSPSFWFGLQTQKGTGALIQPILAWSQTVQGGYGIFHEV